MPALQCRLVALASADEADALSHDDPELAAAFFRLDVPEPEPEVARLLVAAAAERLAGECGVALGEGAVEEAVALTARFVPNERLPGKAVAVLARACRDAEPGHALSRDEVVRTVALQSGVPESVLHGTGDPVDYAAVLGASVVGQDTPTRGFTHFDPNSRTLSFSPRNGFTLLLQSRIRTNLFHNKAIVLLLLGGDPRSAEGVELLE